MLIFNWLCIIMFALTALGQFTDSSDYFWLPVYFWGVSICYRSTKGKFVPRQFYIAFVLYVFYAVYLMVGKFDLSMHGHESSYWAEKSTEFYGLIILLVSLGCNFIWFKRIRFSETVS